MLYLEQYIMQRAEQVRSKGVGPTNRKRQRLWSTKAVLAAMPGEIDKIREGRGCYTSGAPKGNE